MADYELGDTFYTDQIAHQPCMEGAHITHHPLRYLQIVLYEKKEWSRPKAVIGTILLAIVLILEPKGDSIKEFKRTGMGVLRDIKIAKTDIWPMKTKDYFLIHEIWVIPDKGNSSFSVAENTKRPSTNQPAFGASTPHSALCHSATKIAGWLFYAATTPS
jgi:hypothetical protein